MKKIFAILALGFMASCGNNNNAGNTTPPAADNSNPPPPAINYSIIKVYPHDTTSYTEGLFWQNNALYESTGNYGHSELRKNDLTTGKAEQSINLDKQYFGEGISLINNKIYQLTYKENKVFVYDASTFKKIKEFEWTTGEGWGMTHNDSFLIISNGSSSLYFVDPETFTIKHSINVTDNYGPVTNLNELEWVNGVIYSNIWQTNYIVKIDPASGKVLGKMDLTGLLDKSGIHYDPDNFDGENNVLNGIAYDSAKNCFYITGKMWPALFEIKLNQ